MSKVLNERIEIKPATRHDIKEFYGDTMRESCRAWSAFYDGKLAAIGGVSITRNLMLVFMEMRLESEVPDITIWRSALHIWEKIRKLNYPIMYAVADPNLSTAPAFLERLGFEHVESSARGEIYRWPIQSQ